MYVSWVLGDKLRIVMSSIMRWRRGEIGLVIGRLLSVGRHERAILADRTPPTDDTTPIGTADGPKAIYGRRSLSKPPKPTILDLSHRPHHRRLSHERAILADRTPPTDDPTPIGTANGPKAIYGRRSLSKPPKPTILDLSHRPHHRRLPRQRFSATKDYGTSRGHSGFAPENLTTLPHLSISSATSFPKSAGEPGMTVPPSSARCALTAASAKPAFISVLSLSR